MTNNCHIWSDNVTAQWFIRWVGGEDQAQRESYIEIHQPYPSNHAISRPDKTSASDSNSLCGDRLIGSVIILIAKDSKH